MEALAEAGDGWQAGPVAVTLPPPCDLGAPSKFVAWRKGQGEAFERMTASKARFQVLALATGSGKSVLPVTYARFMGKRLVVLTQTTGLQDQYRREHAEVGMTDVRGMKHYDCVEEGGKCDTASCNDGWPCPKREGGCEYFDAAKAAESAELVDTSYAYWFTRKRNSQGMGKVDVLCADEAHDIGGAISGYLRAEVKAGEFNAPGGDDLDEWRAWARVVAPGVAKRARLAKGAEKQRLKGKAAELSMLANAGDDWVIDPNPYTKAWSFEPLWPGPYLEEWLWQGVEKIILASATITRPMLARLGLSKDDYAFHEFPSPIPVERRPVIVMRGAPRIDRRTSEYDLGRWVRLMDRIIEDRLDRKGIIHSVSYDRAEFIKKHSRYAAIMVLNKSSNTRSVVEEFKRAEAPLILVSPSVHTGVDFAGVEAAAYQIISKVPYQPPSRLLEARCAVDQSYRQELAITGIVQAAGRVCRGPEDIGESFICDGHSSYLLGSHYRAAQPAWFRQAIKWCGEGEKIRPPTI